MAQQNSVEWLVEQLMERAFINKNKEIIEQAKEMHKEEKMYSEEDMIAFLDWSNSYSFEITSYRLSCTMKNEPFDSKVIFSMWFETFKNKEL